MTLRSTSSRPAAARVRRSTALAAALGLAVAGVASAALALPHHQRAGSFAAASGFGGACPVGDEVLPATRPGLPASCAHEDVAPPGVDVDKHVPTAVLEAREGAAAAAVDAAQAEGVPVATQVAAVSDRVPCDGDGSTGYRVQAIYAVTSDVPNRFASVGDQIKQWAAGVDTVFNLSAAKTGGVRDVRFVTASNGDGTCSPTVLNVTLPPGSFTSFGATITAMQNAGFTAPNRKYLMWVDGTGQCGIAQTYTSSGAGQDNPNNGYYPQFARIDTACWGSAQSVEAHELSHTLGSVQGDAPHATTRGHCYDESDRMCYSDGSGIAMRQVCPTDQETLFDCGNDDYYSTYPPAGSYLATHWNTANSRFLIGGGDGTGGGTLGTPTVLGGTIAVNNPAVPGLPTQVAATLEVPTGRTTSVTWTASRSDCVFADKAAVQTTVTCGAGSATSATVTMTALDNTGAKLVRSSALTFSSTPRTATPGLAVNGSTSTYTACPNGKAVLGASVVDQASGAGVKGVSVGWWRTSGTALPIRVASAITDASGTASALVTATAGTYTVGTTAVPTWPAVTGGPVTVTTAPSACSTALTSAYDRTATQAGDPIKVTGVLTATLPDASTAPAAGENVAVWGKADGATTWSSVGTAVTGADGSYAITVKPLVSTSLQVRYAGRAGLTGSTASTATATVTPWTTAVTATPSVADLMAGAPVTVTGSVTQSDGSTATPMASAPVTITYPLAGGGTAKVTATTTASGTYSAVVKPTGSGNLVVAYAGKVGWTASSATSALVVHAWTTAVTASASTTDLMAGEPVTLSGTLTQSDGTNATGMASTAVAITYPLAGGKTGTASATTNASGAWTTVVRPTGTGDVVVRYAGKPGWGASSASRTLTVHEWTTALSLAATRDPVTGYVTATGVLTQISSTGTSSPKASATIVLTYQASATTTGTVRVVTGSNGAYVARFKPGASGNVTAAFTGIPGWAATSATPVPVTVS